MNKNIKIRPWLLAVVFASYFGTASPLVFGMPIYVDELWEGYTTPLEESLADTSCAPGDVCSNSLGDVAARRAEIMNFFNKINHTLAEAEKAIKSAKYLEDEFQFQDPQTNLLIDMLVDPNTITLRLTDLTTDEFETSSYAIQSTSVPEPNSWALLITGLLVTALFLLRKGRSQLNRCCH